ncbi:MAG: hypothetical protein RLZ35_537 [Pseudomonadota bacterium]|jgi:hypothetical protein
MYKEGSLQFSNDSRENSRCVFYKDCGDKHHKIETLTIHFAKKTMGLCISILDKNYDTYSEIQRSSFNFYEDRGASYLSDDSSFLGCSFFLNDSGLSKKLEKLMHFLHLLDGFGKESKKAILQELSYKIPDIKVENDNDVYEHFSISSIQNPKECFETAQVLYDRGYKLVFWVLGQALEATYPELALTALEKIEKNNALDYTDDGLTIFEASRIMMANIILATLPEVEPECFNRLSYQEQEALESSRKSIIEKAYFALNDAGNSDIAVTLRTKILGRLTFDNGLETDLPVIRLGSDASQTILELASTNMRLKEEIALLRRQNAALSASQKFKRELRFTPTIGLNIDQKGITAHYTNEDMEKLTQRP